MDIIKTQINVFSRALQQYRLNLLFFNNSTAMYGQLAHIRASMRSTATNVPVLTTGGVTTN